MLNQFFLLSLINVSILVYKINSLVFVTKLGKTFSSYVHNCYVCNRYISSFFIFNGHSRKDEVTILGAIRIFCYFIVILSRKYSRSFKNSFLSYIVPNILICLKRSEYVCEREIEGDTCLKGSTSFNTFFLLKFYY